MASLTRSASASWHLVRRTNQGRVVYECALALFCSGVNLVAGMSWGQFSSDYANVLVASVAALIVLVAVPLRRVRPILALSLGAIASVPVGGPSLVVAVLSVAAGYRATKPLAILTGYGIALVCCVAGISIQLHGQDRLAGLLLALTGFGIGEVLPGAVAAMIAQRRLLVMTMHQRNLELHQERLLVAGQAQARERNRIAAELHDSLGHRLTLISLYSGGLAQAAPAGDGKAVALLRDASAQAMTELRQILKVLHQDETIEGGRTLDEVDRTVEVARRTGTPIELVRIGTPRPLGLLGEHAGFRVVQEGITNALKHARGAPVRVELRYDDEALFVEVTNPPGLPSEGPSSGQGLHGLTERVRLAGGVLSYELVDARRFRLGAMLPYEAEVPDPKPAEPGDFPQDIRRSSRRQRIGLATVITALVLSTASCVGGVAKITLDSPTPMDLSAYKSIRKGDDRSRLQHLLPDEDPISTRAGDSGERCELYGGDLSEQADDDSYEINYEFCFDGDVLVSKRKVRRDI